MKHAIIWLALALGATGQDYFPLQVGNQWIYKVSWLGRVSTTVVDVVKQELINGQYYSEVRGFEEGTVWLRSSETGTLYRLNQTTKSEEVWAVFGTKEGEVYKTQISPCNSSARVESRTAKASLPASDFYDLLEISYPRGNCADAGLLHELYAPYIGLVERTSDTIAGPRVMRLMYSRTGGITVIAQPETSFTVSLDSSVYPALKDGLAMVVRLTLRTTSSRPLELNFRSSQRYDFVIRNAAGESVYNWAAKRLFALQLGTERIDQGEKNWVELIPLESTDGRALPPGNYTIEATVTSSGPTRFAGTAAFEILAVP